MVEDEEGRNVRHLLRANEFVLSAFPLCDILLITDQMITDKHNG